MCNSAKQVITIELIQNVQFWVSQIAIELFLTLKDVFINAGSIGLLPQGSGSGDLECGGNYTFGE